MFDVIVEVNLVVGVGQVDLVSRVDPRFQFHRTQLVVERVEDHVQRARDGVDAARLPTSVAVVTYRDQKSSVVVLVEQLLSTSCITSSSSSSSFILMNMPSKRSKYPYHASHCISAACYH